jgi:hypothetical protein
MKKIMNIYCNSCRLRQVSIWGSGQRAIASLTSNQTFLSDLERKLNWMKLRTNLKRRDYWLKNRLFESYLHLIPILLKVLHSYLLSSLSTALTEVLHTLISSNCIKQKHSWEADSPSKRKQLPRVVWNPKFCHHVGSTIQYMHSVPVLKDPF